MCRCVLRVGVWIFNVSLLDWPWSRWRGAGPQAEGLQAALPLNSPPSEDALLICAAGARPWWLSPPTSPSLSSGAAPEPGALLSPPCCGRFLPCLGLLTRWPPLLPVAKSWSCSHHSSCHPPTLCRALSPRARDCCAWGREQRARPWHPHRVDRRRSQWADTRV